MSRHINEEHDSDPGEHKDSLHEDVLGGDELSEESVAMLLKNAGPRRSAPDHIKRHVFAEAEESWQLALRRRQSRRRTWIAAAAAVLAVAIGLALFLAQQKAPAPVGPVAVVEAWFVEAGHVEGSTPPFAAGETLDAGTELTTLDGERVALRLGDVSLRLAGSTRVRLLRPSTVELLLGRAYVDTGRSASEATEPSILIESRFGSVSDIGTQFETAVEGDKLQVRVREGRVRVESAETSVEAEAGAEITVDADGQVEKSPMSDQDFTWAIESAPVVHLEGKTVAEILRWVERETGLEIRYESEALARDAETIRARGSLEGLRPVELPEILLPAAGFKSEMEDDVLWVRKRETH